MPWIQDGSGGLAYANGVTAQTTVRRIGWTASANLRQSVTHAIGSAYSTASHLVNQLRYGSQQARRRRAGRRRGRGGPGGDFSPLRHAPRRAGGGGAGERQGGRP